MVKYIGGALLVAAGWLLGKSLNSIYVDRVALINRFKDFVLFCESEINYYKTEMTLIIDKFCNKKTDFDDLIFTDKNRHILMTKETSELINNFLIQVKSMDSESQKGYFKDTENKIEHLLQKSTKDVEVQGKLLKKLIPLIAIGIFILFL